MGAENIDAGRHLPLQRLLPAAVGLRLGDAIQRYRRYRRLEKPRGPSRPARNTVLRQKGRRSHPGTTKIKIPKNPEGPPKSQRFF